MKYAWKKSWMMLLPALALSSGVFAQESEGGEKTATINITITEDGETTTITREIPADQDIDVEEILREYGVESEIEGLGADEQLEIIVRKKKGGDVNHQHHYSWTTPDEYEHLYEQQLLELAEMNDRPMLGVHIKNGEEGESGAIVTNIIEGTAAEKAGLQINDVIIEVDGKPTPNYEAVIEALADKEVGDDVSVKYRRDGAEQTTTATLGKRKPELMFFGPEEMEIEMMPHGENNMFFFRNGGEGDFDFEFEGEEMTPEQREELEQQMQGMYQELENMQFDFENASEKAFLGVSPGCNGDEAGVKISNVTSGSSAESMGIESGDVITKLNGQDVEDFDQLAEIIDAAAPGDEIKVELTREGKKMKLKGNLSSRADVQPQIFQFKGNCTEGAMVFPEDMMDRLAEMEVMELEMLENLEELEGFEFPQMEGGHFREVRIEVRIDDITAEEAANLSENSDIEVKPESDLNISRVEFAPNPNNGQFTFNLDLPERGVTDVRLMDATGRTVYQENLGEFQGFYRNEIDISGEEDGMYFLIITQGDKQFSKKIVKQ